MHLGFYSPVSDLSDRCFLRRLLEILTLIETIKTNTILNEITPIKWT